MPYSAEQLILCLCSTENTEVNVGFLDLSCLKFRKISNKLGILEAGMTSTEMYLVGGRSTFGRPGVG